ncbi:MAG TPA: tetratricopeptide repeat protein [Vicinamibacterales bacterium]|jgi:hypothetical protein
MPSTQERARALAIAQDFGPESLELNRQLVAENPDDTGSRTRLARCLLEAGRLDESETEYREVLRRDPRHLIAGGGLAAVERLRHPMQVEVTPTRVRRAPRVAKDTEPRPVRAATAPAAAPAEPVPLSFAGFEKRAFTELCLCARGDIAARFGPRVQDLLRRVNTLGSAVEAASVREAGHKQLFRVSRSDVHAQHGHWFAFSHGGRWEPQFNIGMFGGSRHGDDWLRVGVGFNLNDRGHDADRAAGLVRVRAHFRHFQSLLSSPRGSLYSGWMIKEEGRLQGLDGSPRPDPKDVPQGVEALLHADPGCGELIFFGKWLTPDQPEDAAVLADPVELVRTIDRVITGLLPLWRALWENQAPSSTKYEG